MKKLTSLPLYQLVYTNETAFLRAMCIEHAIQNLAQEHILSDRDIPSILRAEHRCIEHMFDSCGDEAEAERIVLDEVSSWLEDAQKTLAVIKKEGLPWTLASSRHVFERSGLLSDKSV